MPISELLVFGLIVAGFILFNYVIQRRAAQARQERQEAQSPENMPPVQPAQHELLDYTWGGAAPPPALPRELQEARVTAVTVPSEPSAAEPAPVHPAVRALLRGKTEFSHAIVLMTILGPCRAIEPDDRH